MVSENCCERLAIDAAHPHIMRMNRREFSKGVAALGIAPVLPLPAPASAAKAAANFTPFMYAWAENHVRSGAATCAQTLAQQIQVHPDLAEAIYARILKKGIAVLPGATAPVRAARAERAVQDPVKKTASRAGDLGRDLFETDAAPGTDPDAELPEEHIE